MRPSTILGLLFIIAAFAFYSSDEYKRDAMLGMPTLGIQEE